MRLIFYFGVFLVMLYSCNSEPNVVRLRTVKAKKKEVPQVHANRVLTVEIEGMACEMACGGSIRTHLKATGAVDRVKFDFIDGRQVQKAFISYDEFKISDKKMIELIEKINDKQFTTHRYYTEKIDTSLFIDGDTQTSPTTEPTKSNVSDVSRSTRLPDLFDLLGNLVE
jgi:hypothetical protein